MTAVQGERFVWLGLSGVEILLRPAGETAPAMVETYTGARTGLVLYTADLPATAAWLAAHGIEFRWEGDQEGCVTFSDHDGHWFQLVDPAVH